MLFIQVSARSMSTDWAERTDAEEALDEELEEDEEGIKQVEKAPPFCLKQWSAVRKVH